MGMKVNGSTGLTFPDTTTLASAGQASVQAWVNFNGTGTVAIRAAFNVSSITDEGTGQYSINFTTAISDANYAFNITTAGTQYGALTASPSTTSLRRYFTNAAENAYVDQQYVQVAIFR